MPVRERLVGTGCPPYRTSRYTDRKQEHYTTGHFF
jgi:hypothetical protein